MAARGITVRTAHRDAPVRRPGYGAPHDADAVPPARPQRDQGLGAVVRLVGDVRRPAQGRPGDGVHADGLRRRVQLLRQRRGLRRRRERGDHGPGHRRARLAALVVRADDEGVLGPQQGAQHAEHPEPQVPDARHRRLAGAVRARLRRHPVLPPVRPRHAARGDGVGDERHHLGRQGALLGHQRVGGRRDPRRHRDRRAPPPAQADHRAAAVQHARAAGVSRRSTPGSSPRPATGPRSGARWRPGC